MFKFLLTGKYFPLGLLALVSFDFNTLAAQKKEQLPGKHKLHLQGRIYVNDTILTEATIYISGTKAGDTVKTISTTSDGEYSVDLDLDETYLVMVTKKGYYSKQFVVNCNNIPAERAQREFAAIDAALTLIEKVPDIDIPFLNRPLMIYAYDSVRQNFDFDRAYLNRTMDSLAEVRQIEGVLKNKYFSQLWNKLQNTKEKQKLALVENYKKAQQIRDGEEEINTQKMLRNFFVAGFAVFLVLVVIIIRSLIKNKRANVLIKAQKLEVESKSRVVQEKQKEIIDSLYYARRIQRALITNEKYIDKNLRKLNG